MAQYLSYIVGFYFVGLLFSAVMALRKNSQGSLNLFIAANFLGLLSAAIYFANFLGESVVLANLNWFFHFQPTINLLSAIFFAIISFVCVLIGIYSKRYLQLYDGVYDLKSISFLIALFILGMQAVLVANNTFSFLFFWEVMSVSSFFLVMSDRNDESIKAAFLYFIMTHLGASAILGGFLILGKGDLFFKFEDISIATQGLSPTLLALSFGMFSFGFGSKAGLFPFHVWLPEAHPQAPSNISAMMSGLMLKVAVYGFVLVAFKFSNLPLWLILIVLALGVISAFLGALNAAIEKDIKKALAYSSIENMGIIFVMLGISLYVLNLGGLGFASISMAILVYAIFHSINHALFKSALFLSSGVVVSRFHDKNMNNMGGLTKIMPVFSFAFLIAVLSSLPIAPFGTFFGEWGMIQNILKLLHSDFGIFSMFIFVLILSVIGIVSGLAVFAMVRLYALSMLALPRTRHLEKRDERSDYLLTIPVLALAFGGLFLGFFARPIINGLMNKSSQFINFSSNSQSMFLNSSIVFIVVLFFVAIAAVVWRMVSNEQNERKYKTWDCGQPINETMEYTASAFSAPIRFFFLTFVGRDKKLHSKPVIETNPWIREYAFDLIFKSVWREKVYASVAGLFVDLAERIKKIQSGRIQYYLLFLLFTLIVTLMIVL